MFREALEILVTGLRTGEVSYAGEYYSFKDVRLHLEPYQRPHPPLWYPTDNANSITWLAQEGLNTITHYPPMTTIRELFDLYKRVWQEHKTNPERLNAHVPEPKYGIVRHIYVAETDASLCTKPGLPLPTSSPTLITCAWCRVTLVAGQRTWPIL